MRVFAPLLAIVVGACAGASQSPQPEAEPACAAQVCHGDDGGCDMVVLDNVWIWNGSACVQAYDSGCSVVGPDCDALYPSQSECEAAWSRCLR